LTAAGESIPIILDTYRSPFNVGIGVTVGGTASYQVDVTYDDVFSSTFNPATAQWFAVSGMPAGTAASANAQITTPVTAVRLKAASVATAPLTMTVIQAGMPGG
jgi:hypothetical protein